jgi:hypothetical protein
VRHEALEIEGGVRPPRWAVAVVRWELGAAPLLSLFVVKLLPGQPSGPAVVTGLVTWFLLTGRGDLAPPPGR